MTRLSWALLQDSFHTTLCLRESPQAVATAVLYLAVQCCQLEVPGSEAAEKQWWQVLCPDATEKKLQDIAEEIMSAITDINNGVT